jgi:hypothetical protein
VAVTIDPQEFLLLRLEAMRSVLSQDGEYSLRYVRRWYSREFSTPLHLVGTPDGVVPLDDVLQAFYEDRYSSLGREPNRRDVEVEDLTMTPEEERALLARRDVEEAEGFAFAQAVAMQEALKTGTAKKSDAPPLRLEDIQSRGQEPVVPAASGATVQQQPRAPPRPLQPTAANLLSGRPMPMVATKLPEDVKIVFMTDEDMEREVAGLDPFAATKRTSPQSTPQGGKP